MFKQFKCSLALALSVLLCACAVPASTTAVVGETDKPVVEADKPVIKADKPVVYASFYPIYDFVKKAAGDLAEVRCFIPDGTEPHDWEPSPRDISGLIGADLFLYSGMGFEHWIPSVLSGLGHDAPTAVETSLAIQAMNNSPGDSHHECGHDDHDDHDHGHDDHHHDSHVWLSPRLAKLQFKAICEALQEMDPQNAGAYDEAFKKYSAEFDKLDEEFKSLRLLPKKMIVVTHEAFGYLCSEYGLEQVSIAGYSPEDEPDPARMAQVTRLARENGVTVIFYEELASTKIAQTVASEIGARTLPLSPLEGLSDEERANGDDYFSVMRKNLAALKEALS